MFLVTLLRFFFRRKAFKMANFQISLLLKEPLVAAFSETCALTSRNNVFERGISIPNLSEKLQFFRSHSSIFNFQSFLPPREALVTTFGEQDVISPDLSETLQSCWSHSSVSALGK